jgi:hypothetical protein
MKTAILSIFLLTTLFAGAQTIKYNDENYVLFKLKYADKDASVEDISWGKERAVSEFTLQGSTPAKYSIAIENDSTAVLSRFTAGKWIQQEKIHILEWTLRRVEDKTVISDFKIIDFDKDGNEDLVCWVFTNINGNEWDFVYLNDDQNGKLVKLWDHAGETDIWDRPVYDPETGYISTQLDGSAYGTSEESLFLLDKFEAIPVSKHVQDRTQEIITDHYYIGNNGKWELYQSFIDNTRTVDFLLPNKAKSFENIDWKKEKLSQEFILAGQNPLKFRITLINDNEALLEQFLNNKWTVKDTLDWFESETRHERNESFTGSFIITDFNRDGNEDLICWHLTNVNGNQHTTILLNDPKTKTLVQLKNADDDVWSSPEYDKLTDIITSTIVSDMFGVSSESTYRLDGLTATPLVKKEFDSLKLDIQTGTGRVLRIYKGENDKWVLVSEEQLQPEPNEN